MVELLGYVHKSLYPIYVLYSDSTNFICFKQFMKFMKDFEIFPNILSHSKLTQLYHELNILHDSKPTTVNRNDDKENSSKTTNVIDQHLFIECLAIIASHIEYPEHNLTNVQKLIILLQKMNDSENAMKVSVNLGSNHTSKFDFLVN